MKKRLIKLFTLTGLGILLGALIGYLGQCAGST
jgi:hypothetical protein